MSQRTRTVALLVLSFSAILLAMLTATGCGGGSGQGVAGAVSFSIMGLWLVAVSTLGLLAGCGSGGATTFEEGPGSSGSAVTPTNPVAVQLAFVQQPTLRGTRAEALSLITPAPQVEALDADGNRVTTFTDPITITLGGAPPGAVLLGTTTRNAVAGLATFDDLRISLAGAAYTR